MKDKEVNIIKVEDDYHDRGMMKWQGFMLTEMTDALNDEKKTQTAINDLIAGEVIDDDFFDEE